MKLGHWLRVEATRSSAGSSPNTDVNKEARPLLWVLGTPVQKGSHPLRTNQKPAPLIACHKVSMTEGPFESALHKTLPSEPSRSAHRSHFHLSICGETSILLPTGFRVHSSPTNSVPGIPFLHIPTTHYLLFLKYSEKLMYDSS